MKEKIAVGLFVGTCVGLFAAGITNSIVSHTGGNKELALVLTGVFGLVLAWGAGGLTYETLKKDEEKAAAKATLVAAVFILCTCITFFFLSGVVDSGDYGSFAVKENGNQISLYKNWGMSLPYSGTKVYEIGLAFGLDTEGILQTDRGSVRWQVNAEFARANYDEYFNAIRQAGGFIQWREQVRDVLKQATAQYIAANFSQEQILPSEFSFKFSAEQIQALTELAASPYGDGNITAKGMKVILAAK